MTDLLLSHVINGLVVGCLYAMIAVGMTMIFGVLNAINFAHGEYYMLGAFSAWYVLEQMGIPYFVSIFAAVAITAAAAALIAWLIMRRLIGAPFQAGVLATLGISLILQNGIVLVFGGTYQVFPPAWSTSIQVLGTYLTVQRLAIVAVALAMFVALELAIKYTRFGKAFRAVSQNTECCRIVGIDVEWVVLVTFVLGASLAALGGVLAGPVNVNVYGAMGEVVMLKCFAIVVMGGLGYVRGALLAALLLGVTEGIVAGYIGLQFRDAVAFVVLIAVLMLKPEGLFSARARI